MERGEEVSDKELEMLWEELGDVPVVIDEDNCEVIDEDFHIWRRGHDKYEIWQWFDRNHSIGLAKGIMHLEKGNVTGVRMT